MSRSSSPSASPLVLRRRTDRPLNLSTPSHHRVRSSPSFSLFVVAAPCFLSPALPCFLSPAFFLLLSFSCFLSPALSSRFSMLHRLSTCCRSHYSEIPAVCLLRTHVEDVKLLAVPLLFVSYVRTLKMLYCLPSLARCPLLAVPCSAGSASKHLRLETCRGRCSVLFTVTVSPTCNWWWSLPIHLRRGFW